MRTDDLIAALAADGATSEAGPTPPRGVALALALGGAAVAAIFFAALGPRHDLAASGALAATAAKCGLALLLALAAAGAALRLARPGARPGVAVAALFIVPLALGVWAAVEFATLGAAGWSRRLVGTNALHCLMLIPAFALIPLAGLLAALRRGAPTRPALAGAAAGVAAAGVGALFYALNCTDDSPLFIAAWYSLATAMVAGLGALAADRLLRW